MAVRAGAGGVAAADLPRARRPHALRHARAGSCRGRSPPSTTGRCAGCCGSSPATPCSRRPRSRAATGDVVHTDRGDLRAPLIVDALGWRRVLGPGEPTSSRPRRSCPAASRSTRTARGDEIELWLDRSLRARRLRAGPSRPTASCASASGSFDPRYHVKDPTVRLADDLDVPPVRYQGNWIPHRIRPAAEDGVFFVGDSRRPLPAHHGRGHPHRAVLRPGLRARAARGRRGPPHARGGARALRRLLARARLEVQGAARGAVAGAAGAAARAARVHPRCSRVRPLTRWIFDQLPEHRAAVLRSGVAGPARAHARARRPGRLAGTLNHPHRGLTPSRFSFSRRSARVLTLRSHGRWTGCITRSVRGAFSSQVSSSTRVPPPSAGCSA